MVGLVMKSEFKEQIKQRLCELKAEVLQTLVDENNDLQIALADKGVQDLADLASNDVETHILETVGLRNENRLQRIEAALARLENGHFGFCANCGDSIDYERLKAIPYVVLCIDCKSHMEKPHT